MPSLPGMRVKMDADNIESVIIPNLKDLRIGGLDARVASLQCELNKVKLD